MGFSFPFSMEGFLYFNPHLNQRFVDFLLLCNPDFVPAIENVNWNVFLCTLNPWFTTPCMMFHWVVLINEGKFVFECPKILSTIFGGDAQWHLFVSSDLGSEGLQFKPTWRLKIYDAKLIQMICTW